MDLTTLREKTSAELQGLLKKQRDQVQSLRFKVSMRQLKNIREYRAAKKEIARILTVLNEKRHG